ncbi:MAG: carbon-nitrogen hydrolase family protein [Bacilli bacterium]|nr:carbon-nitrogen hydrolase family protein [Bacilli bacterium]
MARYANIISIQPIGGDVLTAFSTRKLGREMNKKALESGFSLAEEAIKIHSNADIICFPELFNVFLLEIEEAIEEASFGEGSPTIIRAQKLARDANSYVLFPILEYLGSESHANTTLVIGRDGSIIGSYRKTHCTENEKKKFQVVPGDDYPIFELDFGKIGVMTCWDAYFPEVARILSLDGAEIIFHPRWMSGPSEITNEIQIRARAIDNSVYLVPSSYGIEKNEAWRPGMFFGRSSIIAPSGIVIADSAHHAGYAFARIDLDDRMLMDVLDTGGAPRDLGNLVISDRRPETYGHLCR